KDSMKARWISLTLLLLYGLSACTTTTPEPELLVTLVADGRERTFSYLIPVTVGEFLEDAAVELSDLDRVNPQPFTQIFSGMIVTVVRVIEETRCDETELPYRRQTVFNEGLAPSEERIGQAGQNGREQVCYRVRTENGVQQTPVETSRIVLQAPQDEIVYVGPSGQIDPVAVNGTLMYISNGNAWVIRSNSGNKRPITTNGDLDEVVFTLAPQGQALLFSRELANAASDGGVGFANTLWVASDFDAPEPRLVQLVPQNVLQAHWIPGLENTISYSTAEASETAPGWRAYNDLWAMRFDPISGESLRIEQLIEPSSFGLYSWWGTHFQWSNSGEQLAWVRADSMGLVDLTTGTFQTLVEYPVFNTRQSWSWRAGVSWSPDDSRIATTVHVAIGNYPPETSPAFSVAVVAPDRSFSTPIVENSGIWSSPRYSAVNTLPGSDLPSGYLAYLRARDPFNSINGEYDLIIADRDGSNARAIFPESQQQSGLTAQEFAWSPDGRQIAFIYLGNLWILDVQTAVAQQLTLDGAATTPVWMP
ncbi:MAG: G5 domain-containing protein, partial [Phototrophicaceae bacterium]